jgi:hypothetical protein
MIATIDPETPTFVLNFDRVSAACNVFVSPTNVVTPSPNSTRLFREEHGVDSSFAGPSAGELVTKYCPRAWNSTKASAATVMYRVASS